VTIRAFLGDRINEVKGFSGSVSSSWRNELGPHEGLWVHHPTHTPHVVGHVLLEPDSFDDIARCMMEVNAKAASKAFAAAIVAHIARS
jgi:hypothetical protein